MSEFYRVREQGYDGDCKCQACTLWTIVFVEKGEEIEIGQSWQGVWGKDEADDICDLMNMAFDAGHCYHAKGSLPGETEPQLGTLRPVASNADTSAIGAETSESSVIATGNLIPYDALPLGARFRYAGGKDVWVKLENGGCGVIAQWEGLKLSWTCQGIYSFEVSEEKRQSGLVESAEAISTSEVRKP